MGETVNNEKEFTPEERSAMCDSIDESQNGPDSTSKAVPPQIQWFASDDGELTIITPDGKKRTLADHAAEIERLSKEVEADRGFLVSCPWCGEKMESRSIALQISHLTAHGDEINGAKFRAESKLSQLQLSNEEKAKKVVERIWGDIKRQNYKEFTELDSHVAAYVRNSWETFIVAILNGGQQ